MLLRRLLIDIAKRAEELEAEYIGIRRHIHANPETAFCEYATARHTVGYYHAATLLEKMASLKKDNYVRYQHKIKSLLNMELVILDDFLLHTLTEEREVKILFELLEKRSEALRSTIVCSQRDPANWSSMIMNDEVSANAILKRATKHYTVIIRMKEDDVAEKKADCKHKK